MIVAVCTVENDDLNKGGMGEVRGGWVTRLGVRVKKFGELHSSLRDGSTFLTFSQTVR